MLVIESEKKLLFNYEVLRARLDIRDFFLKYAVREVYENIGQVLSLVRMQLAVWEINSEYKPDESASSPGSLIGKSIRDVRALAKSFYPDQDIIKAAGFIESLHYVINILYPGEAKTIKITGEKKEIEPELALIVFKMIKEMLTEIKEEEREFVKMTVRYTEDDVQYSIVYTGEEIRATRPGITTIKDGELTLHQRAELIKGTLKVSKSKSGFSCLLSIPSKKNSIL